MSIASEITRINTNISNAYTAIDNQGGTLPVTQNSANLATAIASIPTGLSGVYFIDSDSDLENISNPQEGDIALVQNKTLDKTNNLFNQTTPQSFTKLHFSNQNNIYLSDMTIRNLINMGVTSPVTASGLTDSRFGISNLCTITITFTSDRTEKATITFNLKVPKTANTYDEINVIYETRNAYDYQQWTFKSASGLDANYEYSSDDLPYVQFTNFIIQQGTQQYYEDVTANNVISSNIATGLIPGGAFAGVNTSYVYDYYLGTPKWIEQTSYFNIQTSKHNYNTESANYPMTYVCPKTVSSSASTAHTMTHMYSGMYSTDYKNYLKRLDLSGTRLATYFKTNGTATRAINLSNMCYQDTALEYANLKYSFIDPGYSNYYFYNLASCFSGCTSLKTAEIPQGTSVNSTTTTANGGGIVNFNNMFYNCTSLENVNNASSLTGGLVMPSSAVLYYDTASSKLANAYTFNGVFYNCTSLKIARIALPSYDAGGGKSTFLTRFSSIAGSNGLDLRNAFYNCTSLTDVYLTDLPIYEISQNGTVYINSTTFYNTTCTVHVKTQNDKDYIVAQTGISASRVSLY